MTLVAAMGSNREIGYRGNMPWHLPRDLQHFKALTMGHPVLMGRKTWEALPFALPGRRNIVITRQADYPLKSAAGADVHLAGSLPEACAIAGADELMIIGGAQLYTACLPWASVLELTLIEASPQADTWFPEWHLSEWQEVSRIEHPADEDNAFAMSFVRFQRLPVSQSAITG